MQIITNGLEEKKSFQRSADVIRKELYESYKKAYDEVSVCPVCKSKRTKITDKYTHLKDSNCIYSYFLEGECTSCNSTFQSTIIYTETSTGRITYDEETKSFITAYNKKLWELFLAILIAVVGISVTVICSIKGFITHSVNLGTVAVGVGIISVLLVLLTFGDWWSNYDYCYSLGKNFAKEINTYMQTNPKNFYSIHRKEDEPLLLAIANISDFNKTVDDILRPYAKILSPHSQEDQSKQESLYTDDYKQMKAD